MARTLYPLPDVIDPPNKRCVIMQIPDDIGHITVFLGAIYNLSKWYSWQRDENKRGRLVASVWAQIYDDLQSSIWEGCEELVISNFRQNGCVLEALMGGRWIPIFEVKSDCVRTIVNQGISDGSITTTTGHGRGDSRSISEELENETKITSDLNKVWGGCLELAEYVLETTRLLLDLLQASDSALQAMRKWMGKLRDTIKKTVKDKNGNDIEIEQDIVLGDDGEALRDLPVDNYGNNSPIDPEKILGFFENMLDIGIAVIRAGLTETFLEEIACELFTILTCLPDGTRNEMGTIKLTKDSMYQWAQTLLTQTPLDALIGAVIVIDDVIGTNEFLSFMNLGDAFRQYTLGTLVPLPTWAILCPNCPPPPTEWIEVFDFTASSHSDFWQPQETYIGQVVREACVYVAGSGWGNQRIFDRYRQREIAGIRTLVDTTTFKEITIEFQVNQGSNGSFMNSYQLKDIDTDPTFLAKPFDNVAGFYTFTEVIDNINNTAGLLVQVNGYQRAGDNNPNGSTFIRKIIIKGDGFNPFA